MHELITHTQRLGYALPLALASFRTYASTFGLDTSATALTVESHGNDFVQFIASECERQMEREEQEAQLQEARNGSASHAARDLAYERSHAATASSSARSHPAARPVVQSSLTSHFTPQPAARPLATTAAPSVQRDDSQLDDLDLANLKVREPQLGKHQLRGLSELWHRIHPRVAP